MICVAIFTFFLSAFTILFMFWTISNLAKKLALKSGELSEEKYIAILGSGIVGSLAYTFSDTFWFSAVEGEVYAMSSFLMALLFWLGLKWESELNTGRGNRGPGPTAYVHKPGVPVQGDDKYSIAWS